MFFALRKKLVFSGANAVFPVDDLYDENLNYYNENRLL